MFYLLLPSGAATTEPRGCISVSTDCSLTVCLDNTKLKTQGMQYKNIALVFSIANLLRNHLTKKMSKIITGLKGKKVYMVDIWFK